MPVARLHWMQVYAPGHTMDHARTRVTMNAGAVPRHANTTTHTQTDTHIHIHTKPQDVRSWMTIVEDTGTRQNTTRPSGTCVHHPPAEHTPEVINVCTSHAFCTRAAVAQTTLQVPALVLWCSIPATACPAHRVSQNVACGVCMHVWHTLTSEQQCVYSLLGPQC